MKRVKGTEEGQDWKARALLPLPLEEPATSSLVTWSHHGDETSTSDGGTEVDFDAPASLSRSCAGSGVPSSFVPHLHHTPVQMNTHDAWRETRRATATEGPRVALPWLVPTAGPISSLLPSSSQFDVSSHSPKDGGQLQTHV